MIENTVTYKIQIANEFHLQNTAQNFKGGRAQGCQGSAMRASRPSTSSGSATDRASLAPLGCAQSRAEGRQSGAGSPHSKNYNCGPTLASSR
jgi:hypothetical protein